VYYNNRQASSVFVLHFSTVTAPPLALLAVLLQLATPLQGPTPTPAKASQAEQEKARAEQGVTQPGNQPAKKPPPTVQQSNPEITVRYDQQFSQKDQGHAPIDWPSWAVAFFTLGLLILARCQYLAMDRQAKLMHRQAIIMRRQLAEMKTSGEDTHTLAVAASNSAAAMSGQFQAILKVTKAWVSVAFIEPIDLGVPLESFTVKLVNKGLSPALGMKLLPAFSVNLNSVSAENATATILDTLRKQDGVPAQGESIIASGAFSTFKSEAVKGDVVIKYLREQTGFVLVGAIVTYTDIFGGERSTTFVSQYSVSDKVWKRTYERIE
jgi:hypothetical protein